MISPPPFAFLDTKGGAHLGADQATTIHDHVISSVLRPLAEIPHGSLGAGESVGLLQHNAEVIEKEGRMQQPNKQKHGATEGAEP